MKKYTKPIVICLAVFLVLSILCYTELGSFNLLRTGFGLARVMLADEAVAQIADYPHKAYLVSPDDGYKVFKTFLSSEGYELLECEQMGSQFKVERDGVREYVYWSANGYFHKWVWGDTLPALDLDAPVETVMPLKPVIYLYPEEVTDVTVKLRYSGELTCVYPEYRDGWRVTAHPDGTLFGENGMQYNYLYWEGSEQTFSDMTTGFCVAGKDTAAFLEDALAKLGLNRREANEFIVYWLPLMEDNPYNLISFQGSTYTDAAKLDISPAPDTVIRVFMAWQPLEEAMEIEPQTLTAPQRSGFTVVEWGGSKVK